MMSSANEDRYQNAQLHHRPRRNRRSPAIRQLLVETQLQACDLIMPLFVMEGSREKEAIAAMPGQFRLSQKLVVEQCRQAWQRGILAVALFPVIANAKKDSWAKESLNRQGILPQTVVAIKDALPDICVITDVAMDPYSSDGHDGVVKNGEIVNDETLEILAQMALVQAEAGADYIAPSDMMDGRVGFLRTALDQSSFENVGIISYAAKYASAFYGPFRDALDSAPRGGDKKTYQMNPGNIREALREVALDVDQSSDMVMVKPALSYLDVISRVRANCHLPVAAYNVSGEYSMIKAAAERGWLEEKPAAMESLTSIKRAGADLIFTYWAMDVAQWLSE